MELLLLPSSRLTTTTPYSSSQRKSSVLKHSHPPDCNSLFFSNITNVRKLNLLHLRPRASVSAQASLSPAPGTTDAINQDAPSKDENLVFVAGATGKVGSRTVRELLKLGFGVRAGVRSAQKAQTLVQSAQQLTLGDGASAVEKLEIVECDLEQDSIVPAIGNASTVICCIGASEKEVLDITGPYRIDYQATKNLIDAATVAGVNHFILLTSLGTNKIGFPAAILNLFWGVLIWKRKAEEALIASGLPYTIVRPGGMERPTDAYKETHNVSLSKEDTLFGGQVSNLQVAELMAFMTKRRDLSCYKVVEVIAETTAPLSPFEELLSKLPSKQVKSTSRKETQIVRRTDTASPQITSPEGTSFKTKVPFTMPSSYILYEDLKPPASPAPSQSTSQASAKDENGKVTVAQKISTEPPKSASDKEVIIKDVQSSGSLSPYTVYDNLKPPTSPTPTASDGKNRHSEVAQAVPEPTAAVGQVSVPEVTSATTETETASLKVQETSPLSPYHVYEDLKPPASPSPSAPIVSPLSTSTTGAGSQISPQQDSSLDQAAKSDTVEDKNHIGEPKPRPLSPFIMYDDLKPPASPSPSAPIVLLLSTSTTSAGSQISPQQDTSLDQAAKSDAVEDKNHIVEPELRPLSPFSMYEDLKPPSSPIPSPP